MPLSCSPNTTPGKNQRKALATEKTRKKSSAVASAVERGDGTQPLPHPKFPGEGGGGNRPSPVAEVVSPLGMNRCRDIRSMANGKGEWPQMVPKTRPYRGYRNPAGADASPLRRACSSPGSREPREIRLGIPKSIFRADDTELTDHAQER